MYNLKLAVVSRHFFLEIEPLILLLVINESTRHRFSLVSTCSHRPFSIKVFICRVVIAVSRQHTTPSRGWQ